MTEFKIKTEDGKFSHYWFNEAKLNDLLRIGAQENFLFT